MNDLYEPDELIQRCHYRASRTYQADGILSHERVADNLGRFVAARLSEEPDAPSRAAMLSIVGREVRIATYLSCGQTSITHALTNLIRLALPYAAHQDYDSAWSPDTP
jgi:hypothetical protein